MRGEIPQNLRARFADLDRLPTTTVPDPWRQTATFAVGGLADVGFAESTDFLLAISSAGRGVFDCAHGTLLGRDDSADFGFDVGNLLAEGLGPLAHVRVRTSGLHGGGLALTTVDGWSLERDPRSWPDEQLFLSPPGQTMLWQPPGQPMRLTKLADLLAELRAYGFSPTGRTFIVATAADIRAFAR